MNKTLPKKFTSIFPPTVVNLPTGRFVVITGPTKHQGWYLVSNSFTYEKALKGWTRWSSNKQKEKQPTKNWEWKVANSKNNGFYTVTFDKAGWSCNCTGFGYRRKCRHVEEAKTKMN